MKLIKQKYNYHVSLDTVEEFEQIILADPTITSTNEIRKTFSKAIFLICKFFLKYNKFTKSEINVETKTKLKSNKSDLFSVLMGPDFSKCLPYFLFPGNKHLFMFDAWPKEQESIIKFLNFFKIKNVFFTSSQAAEIIQSRTNTANCFWVPEGINPEMYKFYDFKDKTIDVLALGRRYDSYHKQIVTCLENKNKLYLYEKQRGNIIFPTRNGFIDGIAKSKISICVPSSITHPERSGEIEVMTIRYLQSMVSKCIILGHAPKEMITLFGYNPVIEIDSENPEDQILSILNNYSDYFPLIEKNYQAVLERHTWQNRWNEIKLLLNQN